jgi:hypothetical protein
MFENFTNLLVLLGTATLTYFVYCVAQAIFEVVEYYKAEKEYKEEIKRAKAQVYELNAYRRGA